MLTSCLAEAQSSLWLTFVPSWDISVALLWCPQPLGKAVTYTFDTHVQLENIHFAFDSDLDRNTLPGDSCERRHSMRANRTAESPTMCMPKTLVKGYRVTGVTASGETVVLAETERNLLQCVNIPVDGTYCAVSFIPLSTWNGDETDAVRVFSFDVR